MSKTDYQEASVLNALTGIYVGLVTSSPSETQLETGTATEATYSGYARKAITLGTLTGSGPDSSTPSTRANTNSVSFAPWPGGGTVYTVGFYDSLSGGNALYYADNFTPTSVSSGDAPSFPVGDLSIQEW